MIDGKKVLGVIGGMGPMATVDFYKKIVASTRAEDDAGHIHVLIDGNAHIPDRTGAILCGGESPLPAMVQAAERLERAGADLLAMPCNTAHYFHAELSRRCALPLLDMIELTALELRSRGLSRAALLATDGTVSSGIYERRFEERGLSLILPDAAGQKLVMELIYGQVKAGLPPDTDALRPCLDALEAQGAQVFILGCTELPPAFTAVKDRLFADPSLILAQAAVRALGYEVRKS